MNTVLERNGGRRRVGRQGTPDTRPWRMGDRHSRFATSAARPAGQSSAHPMVPATGVAMPTTPAPASGDGRNRIYLRAVEWGFAAFNSIRVFTYLPTMWAIHRSGDSSQHSLLTWGCWVAANALMAAWLFEHNGRLLNRAIAVSAVNAMMCLVTATLISAYR